MTCAAALMLVPLLLLLLLRCSTAVKTVDTKESWMEVQLTWLLLLLLR
jgi:hypothetical protein